MATPHCPRCDRPVRSVKALHLACAIARAQLWLSIVAAVLVALVVVVVVVATRVH
jgi:hypothetical protein